MTSNVLAEDLELFHYGVKGMKWGVRKDRDAKRSASKAKKAEKKRFNNEMNKVLDKRFFPERMNLEKYKTLSEKTISVSAGTELKRVVSKRNKDAEDRYVSTNPDDSVAYRVALGRKFLGVGERHEVTLKSVNKLTSPSEKERFDAFVDILDKPSVELKNGKTVTGREFLRRSGYPRSIKKLEAQELGFKTYQDFLTEQWTNSPINSAYFKEISSRGYNSIVDDNDAGIVSREPLIVLNPSGDLKRMSIRPLTKEDVKLAESQFKAPD